MKNLLVFSTLVVLLAACGPLHMPVVTEEIVRFTSPDGRVDAIILTSDAGATTATAHEVYIAPRGTTKRDLKHPVFTADYVMGLKVKWIESKHLEVQYQSARIFHFTNFWQSADVDYYEYEVKIEEKEQSPESNGQVPHIPQGGTIGLLWDRLRTDGNSESIPIL